LRRVVHATELHRVLLTQRKRRQILKGLLPLLVIVWAAMPGLPCCQAVAGAATENSVGTPSRGTSVHRSHASLKKATEQSAQLTSAKQVVADRDAPASNTD